MACWSSTMRSRAIGGAVEHEVEKQRLAQRRRHLGDEDRVRRVDERLVRVRQERVHRVPHLVRQREHRVERVVVVEQHVRVDAVHRRRVGAAPLAGILVDVDPVAEQRVAQLPLVVGAERRRPTPAASRAPARSGYLRSYSTSGIVGIVGVIHDRARARACAGGGSGAAARRPPSSSR